MGLSNIPGIPQGKLEERHDAKDVRGIPGKRHCWLSGYTNGFKPLRWNGPWMMHVAHLSSGSGAMIRVDDRRAVVLLSPLAHECHVHDRRAMSRKRINTVWYPTIDAANLIWIKQVFDPEFYDPSYIERIWTGTPPSPERPPAEWLALYTKNTGIIL